jgi:hypothetical protein
MLRFEVHLRTCLRIESVASRAATAWLDFEARFFTNQAHVLVVNDGIGPAPPAPEASLRSSDLGARFTADGDGVTLGASSSDLLSRVLLALLTMAAIFTLARLQYHPAVDVENVDLASNRISPCPM